MAKQKRRKSKHSVSQVHEINKNSLTRIRKQRACLKEILGLEPALCVCVDAYKDIGAEDPSCQAHEWRHEIENVICRNGLRVQTIEESDVYFVQAADSLRIKIGVAKDPVDRIRALQVGCPDRLTLIATMPCAGVEQERKLHHRFRRAKIHGEWFEPTILLMQWIEQNAVLTMPF